MISISLPSSWTSVSPTYVTTVPTGGFIIDSHRNFWTLTESTNNLGLQVTKNGNVDKNTWNVVKIGYVNGKIYHENSSSNWYVQDSSASLGWSATTAPEVTITTPPIVSTTGVQAASSDAFVDSIGVNVHFNYQVYINNIPALIQLLKESGIRHVRDGAPVNAPSYLAVLKQVQSGTGVKFCLGTTVQYGTTDQYLDGMTQFGVSSIDCIEGINEPDAPYFGSLSVATPDWHSASIAWQQKIYAACKANSNFANIPILCPALTTEAGMAYYANGVMSAVCDATNLHCYGDSYNPESAGWGGNGYGSMQWNLTYLSDPVSTTKPVYATETGYNTCTTGVSQDVYAKYLPRLFLNRFGAGVVRSYAYEFYDEGTDDTYSEDCFGLIYNNLTPKPVYTAVQNMIALMADPGPSFTPGKLNYTLSGNTTNVISYLFGKRDGTFILALVLATSIWNVGTCSAEPVTPQNVTVSVEGANAVATANPNVSSIWTSETLNAGEISVSLADSVLLLHFS
jgi:hypothetical protein